jgi:hypothetical protein
MLVLVLHWWLRLLVKNVGEEISKLELILGLEQLLLELVLLELPKFRLLYLTSKGAHVI